LWFRYPQDVVRIKCLTDKTWNLDVKADGGYVVAPPSRHISGRAYRFSVSMARITCPDWVIKHAAGPAADDRNAFEEHATGTDHGSEPWSEYAEAKLWSALEVIPSDDRDVWLKYGAAIYRTGWPNAWLIFNKWSAKSSNYEAKGNRRTWDSFAKQYNGTPATLGSIYHDAKERGWTAPPREVIQVNEPWREPHPLPDERPPVLPFDYEYLPNKLRPAIEDISDRMQCPPEYVAIASITALGGVLGCKVGIRPQQNTIWTEVGNLWGLIIGRPGAIKSPAVSEALTPLKRLETIAIARNEADLKQYKQDVELWKLKKSALEAQFKEAVRKGKGPQEPDFGEEPEAPKPKRYLTNDSTYEKLGELLIANPSGILVSRDELISLLIYLDREENATAKAFFMTGWNGLDSYSFDRIIRGHQHIPRCCISVLGTTQPAKIGEYVKRSSIGGGDGLIQRFSLAIWPDEPLTWIDRDVAPNTEARDAVNAVFKSFDEAKFNGVEVEDGSIPFLRFGPAGQSVFLEWRTTLETRIRSRELPPMLESHLSKYRTLVPAYALHCQLVDNGGDPVDQISTLRAVSLAAYLESHAKRLYGAAIMAEIIAAKEILKHIRKGDLKDGFTARDVYRQQWIALSDRETVKEALRILCDHLYLRVELVKTGGRSTATYSINPAMFK
jgi:hypothetical protein